MSGRTSATSDYSVGGEALACTLKGDEYPCGSVNIREVIGLINLWAADEANLLEVINLINAWAIDI
jgi:hypothetical protein